MTMTPAMTSLGRWLLHASLGLATAMLAACGGGGQLASGGIVGTGITIGAVGKISSIGSVTVNGVRFTTEKASVSIDGLPATETALKVGMVVAVQGVVLPDGTASASTVDARTEVKGIVTGVDGAARAFIVLGQRIRSDGLTVFEGGNFDTLLNQYVEVSGFRGAPGDLLATRVEISATIAPGAPLEVTGTVAAFDPAAKTFAIGGQAVDLSQIGAAFLPQGLANGVLATVRGTTVSGSGRLVASDIRLVSTAVPGAENSKVEIEGIVTDFAGAASFRVNGQLVDGRSAAVTGGTAAMLGNGAKVEVEGQIMQGVVVASKIEVDGDAKFTLDAKVEAVDASGLTLNGQRYGVTATTQYEDRSAAAVREFSLAAIRIGDRLSVRATRGATGLVATRIVRLDLSAPPESEPGAKAEGVISEFVSAASFKVAGRKVNASSAKFEGGLAGDLRDGRRVEVAGVLAGEVLMATAVAFKEDDATPPSTGSVEGTITDYISQARFRVDGQLVDAMQARFENGVAADLANGRRVGVVGTLAGGVLVASKVEFKSAPTATNLEVEGSITDFVSVASFRVEGQLVDASAATVTGGTPGDLANGRKVGVVGTLNSGVLRATKLEIKDAPELTEISVKGTITNFVSVANFIVAARSVDASGAKFEHGSAADLANGRKVEIEGTLKGAVLVAKKVSFQ
jgi:hypothetical protein